MASNDLSLCYPRLDYSGCPEVDQADYQLFYVIMLILHLAFFVGFAILEAWPQPRKWSTRRHIRIAVLIVIGFYLLHHISMLRPRPYFGWIASSILFNISIVLIFVVSGLIPASWVKTLLKIMPPDSILARTQATTKVLTNVLLSVVLVIVVITEVLIFVFPERIDTFYLVQCEIWALGSLVQAIICGVTGPRIVRDIRRSIESGYNKDEAKLRSLVLRFKYYYIAMVILGTGIAGIDQLAAFTANTRLWFISNTLFQGGGFLVGLVHLPFSFPSRNHDKHSRKTANSQTSKLSQTL